jgi:hypothetical protein
MAEIMDFKKTDKELYSASEDRPKRLEVPKLPFAFITGRGDPNGPAFAEAVGALYGFSYALRMSEKNGVALLRLRALRRRAPRGTLEPRGRHGL